jgi:single-strand DNA-binding protein
MDKTTIIGNLTRDPEMRVTQNGISVCTFTVAVNQRASKTQREAGIQPPAKYYKVTAWRELGEICSKYLAKGRKVYVEGPVDVSAYISERDGKAHASLELTADSVEFLSSRAAAEAAANGSAGSTAETENAATLPGGFTPVETDELPF